MDSKDKGREKDYLAFYLQSLMYNHLQTEIKRQTPKFNYTNSVDHRFLSHCNTLLFSSLKSKKTKKERKKACMVKQRLNIVALQTMSMRVALTQIPLTTTLSEDNLKGVFYFK